MARRPAVLHRARLPVLVLLSLSLTDCAGPDLPGPDLALTPSTFSSLPGWVADDHAAALPALRRSCATILRQPADRMAGPRPEFGRIGDWQPVCADLAAAGPLDRIAARQFFEDRFRPFQVAGTDGYDGLFTGYYEASLTGARKPDAVHRHPLYRLPPELSGGKKPDGFPARAAIEAGALRGRGLELVWVDDPVDSFFLHIQGSGRVALADGTAMRVGYAGQNGHPYFAIGRALIDRGEVPKEQMSMQAIRAWLAANPDRAQALMNMNASYIFFRELDGDGPIGAQGVALTPERSLAVDRTLFAYGLPVWLDTAGGGEAPPSGLPLRRLMVAQDTGGAIRGAVRGDVFWGHGEDAAARAGGMRDPGRMWVLVPQTLLR
ncbi:MAG: MltA domain-containing protein [Sneathiellaceae bacterium]